MNSIDVTVFVGTLRPLPPSGRPTGMYKSPITGTVSLGVEGFAGDHQADLRVHGGPDKAVHLYPADHYARLAARFPSAAGVLVPGVLGENLSAHGLDERSVRVGERWLLGTAVLQVCQPRNPCWKIDDRTGGDGMAALIAEQGWSGWYWRVVEPGRVAPGDPLRPQQGANEAPTLHAAMALCREHRPSLRALEQLAATPGIAVAWRTRIEQRVAWLKKAEKE